MIHLTCRRSYQLYRSWLWGMNFLDTSDVLKKLSVVSKLIVVYELRIDDVTRMSWHAVLTILLLIFFLFFF